MDEHLPPMDRRTKKSKDALKKSLIDLMKEKDFKKISITEMMDHADLNRGTFYKHYQFKEDVLEEMIEEVIDSLAASFQEPFLQYRTIEAKQLNKSVTKIFEHVYEYRNFYTVVVKSQVLSCFQDKISAVLRDFSLQEFAHKKSDPHINIELLASYQAYAFLGMIIEWIHDDFKHSPAYMADQLLRILASHSPLAAENDSF